jgi:hypothetical protein
MKPGTLLRLSQHIQRVRGTLDGIQLTATDTLVRIITPTMVALYTPTEAEQLAHEAAQWQAGTPLEAFLP